MAFLNYRNINKWPRPITERKRAEIEHQRLIELEETLRQIQKM